MKKLVYLSTSVVFLLAGIISCKQAPATQIINGIVYDASMNNLTIISDQGEYGKHQHNGCQSTESARSITQ